MFPKWMPRATLPAGPMKRSQNEGWPMKIPTLSLIVFALSLVTTLSAEQDIHIFWKETREYLAREPLETNVEILNEPLPYKKYKVTLRSLDGAHFVSLLALPIQGEA